jgi:poly-gamma-glutamate system protein
MKKIYWRPRKVSRAVLVFLAVFSLGAFGVVEHYKVKKRQPNFSDKVKASRLTRDAMKVIKNERIRLGYPLENEVDPAATGVLGKVMTEVTSNTGLLPAKRTSANPNWAAAMVQMLKKGGVKEGDLVAIGFSGSFPALNMATLAAVETLKLKPVAISSATASQYGANLPGLLWIDMERVLVEKKLFQTRSVAVSIGGAQDQATGISAKGRAMLEEEINKSGLRFINSKDYLDGLEQRMAVYEEMAGGERYAAYINVGGGSVSVGTTVGKKAFRPGLNTRAPFGEGSEIDSVMKRFIERGTPVIHLSNMAKLAEKFEMPLEPQTIPPIGKGVMYYRDEPNRVLAAVMFLLIAALLWILMRSDLGFRLLHRRTPGHVDNHPQQMV